MKLVDIDIRISPYLVIHVCALVGEREREREKLRALANCNNYDG